MSADEANCVHMGERLGSGRDERFVALSSEVCEEEDDGHGRAGMIGAATCCCCGREGRRRWLETW